MEDLTPLLVVVPTGLILGLLCLYFCLKKPKKQPELSLDAAHLLHELTRKGAAVVRIEVIDAQNLFLRRPRG